MRDEITEALKCRRADYIEIRVEYIKSTNRGRDLEDISQSAGCGGSVMVLDKGGWGFTSFNDLSPLRHC